MSAPRTPPPRQAGVRRSPRRVELRAGTDGAIIVLFDYAPDLVARIREIPGRRWNGRDRHWTIPRHTSSVALAVSRFRAEDLILDVSVERLLPKTGVGHARWRTPDEEDRRLRDAWRASLERLHTELVIRGRSPRTRKSYVYQTRRFLEFAGTEPAKLRTSQVREYVRVLLEDRALSHSYADLNVSALKFFFSHVLGRQLKDLDLPRPKQARKLPSVLSRSEVLSLFGAIKNRKHRAILMLAYGGGLRVGEVVRLRIGDIDSDREMIHVRQGKGRKDRYVPLSNVALEALREYLRYDPAPGPWLFPGQKPGRHLTERSVQHMFAQAKRRAGIVKPASVHTLRHSYATHLHEIGIGLRYIQSLLGHKSPKTTEIYTHVSRADLGKIQSPLDQIMGPDAPTDD